MTDLSAFRASLAGEAPPAGLSAALAALWWDAKGEWDRAHECAQDAPGTEGSAVHAYLHRKEGDLSNARYWYVRAGRPEATGTLNAEWEALVRELAGESGQ
jgi:hypothetical protein